MLNAKEIVQRYYKWNHVRRITIEITSQCNLRCIHCYHPDHKIQYLDKQNIVEVVKQFKELGLSYVTLTGGEPLMHPDLFEIIRELKRLNVFIDIYTNGTLINAEIIEFLKQYDIVNLQVSVYSTNEKTYNAITGSTNNFSKHLNGLKLLSASGIPVMASIIMMKQNFEERILIRQMCEEYGFNIQYGFRIIPDRNNVRRVDCEMDNYQKAQLVTEINELNEKAIPDHKKEKIIVEKNDILNSAPCNAGRSLYNITSIGDVTPCTGFYKIIGNIFESSVNEIIKSVEAQKIRSAIRKNVEKCCNCENIIYCSYCPGYIYSEHGESLIFDESLLCQETKIVVEQQNNPVENI